MFRYFFNLFVRCWSQFKTCNTLLVYWTLIIFILLSTRLLGLYISFGCSSIHWMSWRLSNSFLQLLHQHLAHILHFLYLNSLLFLLLLYFLLLLFLLFFTNQSFYNLLVNVYCVLVSVLLLLQHFFYLINFIVLSFIFLRGRTALRWTFLWWRRGRMLFWRRPRWRMLRFPLFSMSFFSFFTFIFSIYHSLLHFSFIYKIWYLRNKISILFKFNLLFTFDFILQLLILWCLKSNELI